MDTMCGLGLQSLVTFLKKILHSRVLLVLHFFFFAQTPTVFGGDMQTVPRLALDPDLFPDADL